MSRKRSPINEEPSQRGLSPRRQPRPRDPRHRPVERSRQSRLSPAGDAGPTCAHGCGRARASSKAPATARDVLEGHRAEDGQAHLASRGRDRARGQNRGAVGAELRRGGRARIARRGDARDRRGSARPRALLCAQPPAVPLLLERRRDRRRDRRRGEKCLCHRRRHRRRKEIRRERACGARHAQLRRDGAIRNGARRAPRNACRTVGARRSRAHLRQPAIAQHVARASSSAKARASKRYLASGSASPRASIPRARWSRWRRRVASTCRSRKPCMR